MSECRNKSVCIAAYSIADAKRLCVELGLKEPSHAEIRDYFGECWGNDMRDITPERGVWIVGRGDTPERVVA